MTAFWRDRTGITTSSSGESIVESRERVNEWVQWYLLLYIGGAAEDGLGDQGRTIGTLRWAINDRCTRRPAEAEGRVSVDLSRRYGLYGRCGCGLRRSVEKNVIGGSRRLGMGYSEVDGVGIVYVMAVEPSEVEV